MTERWFLKCRECKKPWAVDIDGGNRWHNLAGAQYATCPTCGHTPYAETDEHGRLIYGHQPRDRYHHVMGKVGRTRAGRLLTPEERSPCDGRCTNARGPNCDCRCGGANHGSRRVVTVWRCADAGRVPA